MHPVLLTFSDASLEKEFHERLLKSSTKSELRVTRLVLLASTALLCVKNRGLQMIVQSVFLGIGLFSLAHVGHKVMQRRQKTLNSYTCVFLHIVWVLLLEAMLRGVVPPDKELLQLILVKSGTWVVLTGTCSPLPARHYLPFQLCIVLSLFFMRPVVYEEGDLFTDALVQLWDVLCLWSGLWLNLTDGPCIEIPLQSKAHRTHFFISIALGFVFPGLLRWVSEAKYRQGLHKALRYMHQQDTFPVDFIPISYTVALTLVTLCLLWLFVSGI